MDMTEQSNELNHRCEILAKLNRSCRKVHRTNTVEEIAFKALPPSDANEGTFVKPFNFINEQTQNRISRSLGAALSMQDMSQRI